jgi:hypothetical protein
MRRSLILFAVGLALAWQAGATIPTAHADDGTVVAARVAGELPAAGVVLALWDGGSVEDLSTEQPEVGSLWVSSGGSLVGYLIGAPDFVNTSFLTLFPLGQVSAGTPVLAVVVEPVVPPPTIGGHAQATWTAFQDTLLQPSQEVSSCAGCWPQYTGGNSIGVTTRWLESDTLDVYVYAGNVEDIAALEEQLNGFQSRLGVPWRYVATPGEANLHAFMSFDRLNVSASFPAWAQDSLAERLNTPGWSAYATTSSSFSIGPNGVDPADRYAIDEAAIYVPFNQQNGDLISQAFRDSSIRHELIHAVGWAEHWNVPGRLMSPSASSPLEVSDLEWDMLELLYDDAVLPGMYDEQILAAITVSP